MSYQLPSLFAACLLLACSPVANTGGTDEDQDSSSEEGDHSSGDGDDSSGDGDDSSGDGDDSDGHGDSDDGDGGDSDGGDSDGGDGDGHGSGDGDDDPDEPDGSMPHNPVEPGPDDPADGPGERAMLEGVWNQPFAFAMSDYPITWAISVVHASMLYRSIGINYTPNAVLSIAIKESALSCRNENPQNAQEQMAVKDGCFQIEGESAYKTLEQLFPERFKKATHAELISGTHFESAALSTVYYSLFSLARFRDYRSDPGDPQVFFDQHPDGQAAQKVLCGAYNRGLWWTQLTNIFRDCRKTEVTQCFGGHAIAIDHALKIADYTRALDDTQPFDTALDADDLRAYWKSISKLYPEVSTQTAEKALIDAFDQYRGSASTLSFNKRIRQVLAALIAVLPKVPTQDQAAKALCELQQLSNCN